MAQHNVGSSNFILWQGLGTFTSLLGGPHALSLVNSTPCTHTSSRLSRRVPLVSLACVSREAKGSAAWQLIKWSTSTFDLGENSQDKFQEEKVRDSDRDMERRERRNCARKRRGKGKVEREIDDRKEGHGYFRVQPSFSDPSSFKKTRDVWRYHGKSISYYWPNSSLQIS